MDYKVEKRNEKMIEWTDTLEDYFAKIGEKAQGYSLLHKQAEAVYSYRTTLIDLPVIILSTVCGTLSIGGGNIFPPQWTEAANQIVGTLSIGIGVLNTVGTYFAWSKRAESHRVSSLQYARMSRFLRVELSLPREERMNCAELLKMTRTDWERLTEIAPMIPDGLISSFRQMYKKRSVSKPDEIHGIEPIRIFNSNIKNSVKNIIKTNLNAIKQINKEQGLLEKVVDYGENKLTNLKHFRKIKNSENHFRQAVETDSDTDTEKDTVHIVSVLPKEPYSPRPVNPQ